MIPSDKWLRTYYNTLACKEDYNNETVIWIEEQKRRIEKLDISSTELRMLQILDKDLVEPRLVAWLSTYEELRDGNYIQKNLKYALTLDGRFLFDWVHNQKRLYKKGMLSESKIKKLEELGIEWVILTRDPNKEHKMTWHQYYKLCKKYYEEYGHIILPDNYRFEGVDIGAWLKIQKRIYHGYMKGKLDESQIKKLNALGMSWKGYPYAYWDFFITTMTEYKKNVGTNLNKNTIYNKIHIGEEFMKVREMFKNGQLDESQLRDLRKLGIRF